MVLVSQRGIRTLCIGRLTLLTGRLTAVAVVGASRALVAPPSSCDVLQAAGCGGGGLDWLTGLMAAVSLPSGSSAWRCEQHRIGIWREDGGSMLFWQRVGLPGKALHFLTLPPAPRQPLPYGYSPMWIVVPQAACRMQVQPVPRGINISPTPRRAPNLAGRSQSY